MSESLDIPSPNGHFSYTEYGKDAESKRDAEDKPLKLALLGDDEEQWRRRDRPEAPSSNVCLQLLD